MKRILVSLLFIGLAGCATTYHPMGLSGGYQDMKIQEDVFKVEFSGNAETGIGKVEDFTLLRSAELALENGYRYFTVLEKTSDVKVGSYTTPVTEETFATEFRGTFHQTTNVYGGETRAYQEPSIHMTIRCFKERPKDISAIVYDAEQVKTNIRNRYGIK